VTLPRPDSAQHVASRVLAELTHFVLESRQTQLAAELRFTQRRLDEAAAELRTAERQLQIFLQTNRNFQNSPELRMRSESLAREVTLRQQIYTNLSQAAAQMRIEGTRDTPMLTVIDAPIRPLHEEPRQVALRSAFAAVVGAGVAAVFVVLWSGVALQRRRRASTFGAERPALAHAKSS
jgi:uncharacterized protein involved in exopolysaccharide biosynthesis